ITDAQPGEGAQALAAAVQVFGLPDGGATLRIRLGRRQVVGVPEAGQVLADQARSGPRGHGLLAGEEQGKQQQAQASAHGGLMWGPSSIRCSPGRKSSNRAGRRHNSGMDYTIKTPEEIAAMRVAGRMAAEVPQVVAPRADRKS